MFNIGVILFNRGVFMEVYYNKIKQFRKEAKLSIVEFCQLAGIGRATLWTWETGRQFPTDKKVKLMAEALNVSVDEISDLEHEKEKSGVKLSETVESWLLLGGTNAQQRIQQQEELISKIRLQQIELMQASTLIRAMMSTLQSLIYVKDNNLKYIIANDIFLENISFDKNYNVLGKDDSSFFSKDEAAANYEEDLEVLKTGKSIIKREGFIPGSRKKKWGFISKFPLLDTFGKIAGVVGTFIDITKQKKLEQKTRQAEIHEMLESTFSTSTEILWLISYKPLREYLYISPSIEKMLGYPVENFYKDRNFWLENCVHPDYKEYQAEIMKNGNCSEKMEYKLINSIGETVWVEEFTFKKTYLEKECIGFITRDISVRKKNEEQWKNQGKLEMAGILKQNGVDTEIISRASGLIVEQINSL